MAAPTFKAGSVAHALRAGGDPTIVISSYAAPALTNGYMVVFTGGFGSGRSVSSVTFGATNLASLGTPATDGGSNFAEMWGKALGASYAGATNDVTVTWNDTIVGAAIVVLYEGVNQTVSTGTLVAANGGAGTPATLTANVAGVADDMIVAGMIMDPAGEAITPTGAQNERDDWDTSPSFINEIAFYDLVATGATTTMAGTANVSTFWLELGVALKQLSGPAAGGVMWL